MGACWQQLLATKKKKKEKLSGGAVKRSTRRFGVPVSRREGRGGGCGKGVGSEGIAKAEMGGTG